MNTTERSDKKTLKRLTQKLGSPSQTKPSQANTLKEQNKECLMDLCAPPLDAQHPTTAKRKLDADELADAAELRSARVRRDTGDADTGDADTGDAPAATPLMHALSELPVVSVDMPLVRAMPLHLQLFDAPPAGLFDFAIETAGADLVCGPIIELAEHSALVRTAITSPNWTGAIPSTHNRLTAPNTEAHIRVTS
jgi:hypothetical protein